MVTRVTFEEDSFPSSDGIHKIRVRRCLPTGTPWAVVQISHGVAEHIGRYDDFAHFLASEGIAVVGNDHLGHGRSVNDPSELGYFGSEKGWSLVVRDMRTLYAQTRAAYPDTPYVLFGHSMGSFLSRTFMIRYPDELDGVVLSGTGWQNNGMTAAGLAAGRLEVRHCGPAYKSKRLNDMAFGGYNKGFKAPRTVLDWLSRDTAVVDQYQADPLCGFVPSAQLFVDMLGGIRFICRQRNLERMRKNLPVFFLSGDADPVGNNGEGVIEAYRHFLRAGMDDVTLKLYHGGRHEMLNELNQAEVYQDILSWLKGKTESRPF